MVTRPERVTAAEIAERFGRSVNTVQTHWMQWDEWPASTGQRGRWLEFDLDDVERVVHGRLGREMAGAGNPDDLLTPREIAEYTGLKWGTVRADVSRGRFGEPDDEDAGGVKRWLRSSVDRVMSKRRGYRRDSSPE